MASPSRPLASCAVTQDDIEMLRNLFSRGNRDPLESWADKRSLEVDSGSLIGCLSAPAGSFAPEGAIKLLCEDPDLAACFGLDAGTGERYTVGEHTERVLACFEKHFSSHFTGTIPLSQFRLFLLLHDIGKGHAAAEIPVPSPQRKRKELEMTSQILEITMRFLQIPEKNIRVFLRLVKEDFLGDYLKESDPNPEEAAARLRKLACEAEMDSMAFLDLYELYFNSDAASYPILEESIFVRDEATGALEHGPANAQKMEALRKTLAQTEDEKRAKMLLLQNSAADALELFLGKAFPLNKKALRNGFFEHLPEITRNLRAHHSLLLKTSPLEDQMFKSVKKAIRDLLLYIALTNPRRAETGPSYQKYLSRTMGQGNLGIGDSLSSVFANQLSAEQSRSLEELLQEAAEFRRDTLLKFSPVKVLHAIRKTDPEAHIDELEYLALRTHGTQSPLLVQLPKTGFTLVPTGKLPRSVVPLSGELERGCDAMGVNRNNLSFTMIEGVDTALSYACNRSFEVSMEREKKTVAAFLGLQLTRIQSCASPEECVRASYAIRRLKLLDPDGSKELIQQSAVHLERLAKQFESLPDADDAYWKVKTECMESALDDVRQAIEEPLEPLTAEEREAVVSPFPMVLGSTRLFARPVNALLSNEYLVSGTARLGKEIRTLFVPQDRIAAAGRMLAKLGIGYKVRILPFEVLERAKHLHLSAAPYLADILSRKKLEAALY